MKAFAKMGFCPALALMIAYFKLTGKGVEAVTFNWTKIIGIGLIPVGIRATGGALNDLGAALSMIGISRGTNGR
jgi:hypothetical protein